MLTKQQNPGQKANAADGEGNERAGSPTLVMAFVTDAIVGPLFFKPMSPTTMSEKASVSPAARAVVNDCTFEEPATW